MSRCTTRRAIQPAVTLCNQVSGQNICIKPTSTDVTLQNHLNTLKKTWIQLSEILKKMRESSTLLLAAEITSPAGLRAVLHHGGSWNNDVTFEPQPGPGQVIF